MASASLWLYRALLAASLPAAVTTLKVRDRLVGKRRPRFADRLGRDLPDIAPDGMWLQAVSVGEVELARRLVAEIRREAADLPLLVSSTTATGLDLARRTLGATLPVIPCPLDLPAPVSRVLSAAQPRAVVLVETELWPELLHQSARTKTSVAVVNARLSERSFAAYRRVSGLLRPLLAPLTLVLARTSADGERFAALGVTAERIVVAGNIKYDVEADERTLEWAEAVRAAAAGRPILVAGSTMEGEEATLLDAMAGLGDGATAPFLVLAPRHPERFDAVAKLLDERAVAWVRRSAGGPIAEGTVVFLLDTIGELARAYGLASVAYIGGSLVATGGHNPLEAAVWGVPVVSGAHVHNFREVYDELTAAGGARLVTGRGELAAAAAAWLDEPDLARAAGAAGRDVVLRNRGATARTVSALLRLIGEA